MNPSVEILQAQIKANSKAIKAELAMYTGFKEKRKRHAKARSDQSMINKSYMNNSIAAIESKKSSEANAGIVMQHTRDMAKSMNRIKRLSQIQKAMKLFLTQQIEKNQFLIED